MMLQVLWDASALIKRYLTEAGSDSVDALWSAATVSSMVTTSLGYVETAAVLRRRRNMAALSEASFNTTRFLLQSEVFHNASFRLLTIDATMSNAIALIDRYNINASDAAILAALLHFARSSADTCLFVAADKRLLRAAESEGLATLNPEALPPIDLPAFLDAL